MKDVSTALSKDCATCQQAPVIVLRGPSAEMLNMSMEDKENILASMAVELMVMGREFLPQILEHSMITAMNDMADDDERPDFSDISDAEGDTAHA